MSHELVGLLAVVAILVLMALRMWVGLVLALVGLAGLWIILGWQSMLGVAGQAPFTFVVNYTFTILPMFILMGNIIAETGIGADLYYVANKWVGGIRGGLAMATTVASAMFAAIVGGTGNGVIVFGKVAYPEMKKLGYHDELSTATIVASSTMGILIPPSMGFIWYGLLTEQSVGKLFIAGIVPGLMQCVMYLGIIWLWCKLKPAVAPRSSGVPFKEKLKSIKGVWALALLFLAVMGSIYLGVCTPTEAGAIGAFGSIVITLVSKKLNWLKFSKAMLDSGILCGMMLLTFMGTAIFAKLMSVSEIPFWIGNLIAGMQVPTLIIIIILAVMYVIAGTALSGFMIVVLTVPIVYPVILALGIDPIWFGVLMVIMIEIGDISPPEGMIVYMMSGLVQVPVTRIFKGLFWFLGVDVIRVVLLIAFPSVVLWLPNLMN